MTSALPFRALSLSRYRLDDAMLRRARETGARLKRNVAVKSVTPDGDGWNVLCDDGEKIYCRHLVLATGKLGLRGVDDARDGSLVGLKMHLRLAPETRRALEGRVELFFLDGSYVGLELIEDGIANLCFVLPRARWPGLGPAGRPCAAIWPRRSPAWPSGWQAPNRYGTSRWPWSVPPAGTFIGNEEPLSIASATGSPISRPSPATASPSRSRQRRWRSGIFGAAARPTPILQRRDNSRPVPSGWRASSRASPGAAEDAI